MKILSKYLTRMIQLGILTLVLMGAEQALSADATYIHFKEVHSVIASKPTGGFKILGVLDDGTLVELILQYTGTDAIARLEQCQKSALLASIQSSLAVELWIGEDVSVSTSAELSFRGYRHILNSSAESTIQLDGSTGGSCGVYTTDTSKYNFLDNLYTRQNTKLLTGN